MRTYLLLAVLVNVFLAPSCRSLSYFESPNNLRNVEGTLFLNNGNTYQGRLIIETENLFSSPVRLYAAGDEKPMQFRLAEVRAYRLKNETFELKEIRESIGVGRRLFFMKRLSPDRSKMHLFEFSKKEVINKTKVRHEPEFYLQLPGEPGDFVYAANSNTFVPSFEAKMSRFVQDCPLLAQKIREKQPGYFYAQVSLLPDKKADVLLRIIDEYNQCVRKVEKP